MSAHWYYQMMGTVFGPHTGAELLELARHHRISPEDLVRKGDTGDWVPAYRVHGLFDAAASHSVSSAPRSVQQNHSAQPVHPTHVGSAPQASAAKPAADAHRAASDSGLKAAFSLGNLFGHKPSGPPQATGSPSKTKAPGEVSSNDYVQLVDTLASSSPELPLQADWFCICHGEKLGPISFRRLRELYASGELKAESRVWSTASPKWCRASEVPGLARSD
ncbi:MAG: DUF4339 domain-containing protein [Pirellulales bacterium]